MFGIIFVCYLIGGDDVLFFDDFKDSQPINYQLLKNSLLNGKISHAYLVDANNNDSAYDFVLAFIKMIICDSHCSHLSPDKCVNCSVCRRIDDGNYPELKIIQPESLVIKKEQLIELQNEFTMSSIEGKYRIYVIRDCDKMNKQAANSLLKFLEEPADNVIAILVTNHFSKLLSTIVSRCQIIRLSNSLDLTGSNTFEKLAIACSNSKDEVHDFLNNTSYYDILNCVVNFAHYFEKNGLDILVFMKKMWYNVVQTREDNLLAFQFMIYLYYDVLLNKVGKNLLFYTDDDYSEIISNISLVNSLDMIVEKIDIILYGYEMINCNLNVNLLLDDIVIRLGEVV